MKVADKRFEMKTEFVINRKDFGIVYPGMPDNLINDDVSPEDLRGRLGQVGPPGGEGRRRA